MSLKCLMRTLPTRLTVHQFGIITIIILNTVPYSINADPNPRASVHPKVLLISFDGFRHDYFDSHGPLPALEALADAGTYVPEVTNVFPTKTFGNHLSLVTGLHPGYHGGYANTIYDRDTGQVVSLFSDAGEKFVGRNPGVLPLWVVNEMEAGDRFSGVSMWPGMNFGYGENYQKSTHALPFNPDITLEERVEIALNWFVHPEKPANFVAFYAETVDENGHDFGPDSDEVSAAVKMADYITDYIVQKLRTMALWDDIHVIVTADHGMSPVFGTNLVNISQETSIMDKLGVSSSSPILFFYKLNENDAEIGQQLEEASERLGFELFDTSNFPEENDWHMGSLQHLPDYLAIIPLNYSFDDAFWLGPWNDRPHASYYGQHGFDNSLSEMHPFFIGHGPKFRSGFTYDSKQGPNMSTLDIYPLICNLLNVTNIPSNNGSDIFPLQLLKLESWNE